MLLNSLFPCVRFFCKSLDFPHRQSCHMQVKMIFLFFLSLSFLPPSFLPSLPSFLPSFLPSSNFMTFICFACHPALKMTFNTTLSKAAKVNPYLASSPGDSFISALSMFLAVDFCTCYWSCWNVLLFLVVCLLVLKSVEVCQINLLQFIKL